MPGTRNSPSSLAPNEAIQEVNAHWRTISQLDAIRLVKTVLNHLLDVEEIDVPHVVREACKELDIEL